jgi:hypothetical protein
MIESQNEELEIVKRYVPSGAWSAPQFQHQQDEAKKVNNSILISKRIVSAVRGQIQEFATRVYYEQLFSHQAGTIFESYQAQVDALLSAAAGTAFQRLPQAFERLGAGEPEAISHALTTCRRVIDSFTDAVFPARAEPVLIGQETIEVSQDKGRNRLRAFIHARIGTCSRYTRLNKTLVLLYDRVSTGVHADVEVEEAKALVLQTYLFQ